MRQGNYAQAAGLAEAALASDNLNTRNQAFAHGVRAAALLHTGRYDQAASDLDFIVKLEPTPPRDFAAGDVAIAAHPDRADAYFIRARLYLAANQYAQAIGDCDIAIGLKVAALRIPARDRAAWDSFDAARFQQTIDDIGDNAFKVEAQPYSVLLLHLARAKLGRNDEQELGRAVDAVGLTEWPAPILAFYLKRIDRDQLFAAAAEGPDHKVRVGQRCEANFYAGEDANLHGDQAGARDLFETAVIDCPEHFFEAIAAHAELVRLHK